VRRSPALLFGVAAASVALDQWAKAWASTALAFHEPVRLLGDLVRLTYTRNSGIAFGMFAGRSFPFYIFSLVASLAVVWLWARHARLPFVRQFSLALILGGAIGNLIDRVRFGEVTDFILLAWRGHEFPVFNVADMCVTCGVVLFAVVWTREPEPVADGPVDGGDSTFAEEDDGPHAGADRAGDGLGSAPGPVVGEGPDRPVP
jgi:signal peptidase II